MRGWLLDTNVLSELRKRSRDTHVQLWIESQPRAALFVSTVSLAEIRYGIARAASESRRHEISIWLDTVLRPWLVDSVIDLDEDTLVEWRAMIESNQATGQPVGAPNFLIAASAKRLELCVATRNSAEFARTGVPLFNPWNNVLEMPGRKPAKLNGVVTLGRLR